MDRNLKTRIEVYARVWSRANRRPGQHRGPLTRATMDVLHALLWTFHNSKTGWCFPSYERISEAAECAVSTVAEAVKALEAAGILTWANRLVRLTFRGIPKIIRTSNAYAFNPPPGDLGNLSAPHKMAKTPKSENQRGTLNQDLSYILGRIESVEKPDSAASQAVLDALATASTARFEQEWLKRKMV